MSIRRSLLVLAAFTWAGFVAAGPARSAEKVDPSGTWTWVRELEGETNRSFLKLSLKDGKLTGTYKRMGQVVPITNGKFDRDEISFDTEGTFNDQKVEGKFKGKFSKGDIKGTIDITIGDNSLPLPWEAKRGTDLDDVLGTWKLKVVLGDGNEFEPELKLAADGEKLKGTLSSPFGDAEAKEIKIEGADVSWKIDVDRDGQKIKSRYKGKLDGNGIKGKVDYDFNGQNGTLEFSGEHEAAKKDEAKKLKETKEPEKKENRKKDPAKKGAALGPKKAAPVVGPTSAPKRRLIVSLKSRRETLMIYSGAGLGPVFSIRSNDGRTLAKEVSLKNLQASHPQFYELYRTAYANIWAASH